MVYHLLVTLKKAYTKVLKWCTKKFFKMILERERERERERKEEEEEEEEEEE